MARADLVQDAIIVMNGQPYTHPKYVGIIRKVDAGMVSAAGKLPPPPPCLLFKKIHHLIPYIFFSARFFHVLQSEAGTTVAGRRASVPTVSSSSVAHASPDRRGSEPAVLQAEVTSEQECSRSELAADTSNPQCDTGHLPANIAEEQSEGIA